MIKITAVGNLARDIEVKEFKDTHVGNFTIAANIGYGENKRVEWIRCSLWGKRALALEPYLKKGTRVVAVGNGFLSTFEGKDGDMKTNLELRIDNDGLSFASSKSQEAPRQQSNESPELKEMGEKEFVDDEIPF